jgi:hypothetical protein
MQIPPEPAVTILRYCTMIESLLYIAIGFLVAALLAMGAIPFIHARAERLTRRRVENGLPFSMAEMHAEKDALRADFAMSTRRLEIANERLRTHVARLMVQVSQKDDQLRKLRGQTERPEDYAAASGGQNRTGVHKNSAKGREAA